MNGKRFTPCVLNYNDYYPFGAPMPGRQFNNGNYRYGFNGKENDNEVKGVGNSLDFGARIYDSRLGRFLSVDPMMSKFPDLSPYPFVANSPILLVDRDGKVFIVYIDVKNKETGETETHIVTFDGTNTTITNQKTGATTGYTPEKGGFVDNLITSYNYIVKSGADVDNALQKLATSKIIKVKVEGVKDTKRMTGHKTDENEGIIKVNFEIGEVIRADEGTGDIRGYESPALGFWSEAYHTYLDLFPAEKEKIPAGTPMQSNMDREEEYVHVKKGGQVIDALKAKDTSNKETKRETYGDADYKAEPVMKSPTSAEPKNIDKK